jgi:hypothetical protein
MRLEDMGKGINWYNDTAYRIWTVEDFTDWHETTSPLPKGRHTIRLRLAMMSDPSSSREGIAIDDVEVFDRILIPGNMLVSISPNPTNDGKINIVWAAGAGTEMRILMTDILGREVYETKIKAQESYNQSTIQTPHFYSGIYLMQLYFGDKVFAHKIVYQ